MAIRMTDIAMRMQAVEDYAMGAQVVWFHRPILVHASRQSGKGVCPCCDSRHAEIVEEREHLDVLVDVGTGYGSCLQDLEEQESIDAWHEVAHLPTTQKIDNPARCSRVGVDVLEDWISAVIYLMGGSQGGKTQLAAEKLRSMMLRHGGRGARFMWVAYTRLTTQEGVNKMARGIEGDRWIPGVIPESMLAYFPKSARVEDQQIRTHDSGTIDLRYASRDGDNLKAVVAKGAVFDEATASDHEENFAILLNRMLTTGGQMVVPSTPKDPTHWLRERAMGAPTYDDIREDPSKKSTGMRVQLSCRDNPWAAPGAVERMIDQLGGPDSPLVAREIDGLWVFTDGQPLWRYFSEATHVVPWSRGDVERYGWLDLTPQIGAEVFDGWSDAVIHEMGGTDFNFRPFSTVIGKIICRQDADQRDPQNLVLYIEDDLVMPAKSAMEYAAWVTERAGADDGRGLKPEHYAGLHSVCDGTGFARHTRDRSSTASADAFALQDAGMVVRAPEYRGSTPCNPLRKVRFHFVHELMWTGPAANQRPPRLLVNQRCRDLIESLKQEKDYGDGTPKKASNTRSDRLSGVTDGLCYLAYASLFHRQEYRERAPAITAAGWG